MSTQVEICRISKSYVKNVPVLKPVDLMIQKGELFFLLGSSGCGKSTLLRIIAGLLKPDGGHIRFNGADITNMPPEKRRAAMVFQNYALWPHLSVFENVAFGLRVQGEKNAEIRRKVTEALELVRLGDCAGRKIQSLSGGQQQRVALARALAVDPAVLLLDEPLSNLDARLRDSMRVEIRRICKKRNLTAIYVTHDRKEALSMADRIAVLHEGALAQVGTPVEVYRNPKNAFVASFLGDANILRGKVVESSSNMAQVETACGLLRVFTLGNCAVGSVMELMIRPENISFSRRSETDSVLRAVLRDGTFLGERTEWRLIGGNQELLVYETTPPPRKALETFELFVAPEHVAVLL